MSDKSLSFELAAPTDATVGEGPVWDQERQLLWWVDVLGDSIHRHSFAARGNDSYVVPQTIGAVALRTGPGLLAAVRQGFGLWTEGVGLDLRVEVESDLATNRMNDGKVDPAGRMWAGTMADDATPGAGALYRLDPDWQVTQHLDGLTVSNGLDWSADGRTMYFIDSGPRRLYTFDFDLTEGTLSNQRTLVQWPEDVDAVPDGMAVAVDGSLWVAMCFGSCVERYDASGELLARYQLPTRVVTSCAFGGPSLDRLFVTTGTATLTDEQRRAQPGAGALFVGQTDTAGRPSSIFGG